MVGTLKAQWWDGSENKSDYLSTRQTRRVGYIEADEFEIDLQPNDIQRVHQLTKKGETRKIHDQSLQGLCHTYRETSFLLTSGISKISKADSTSLFVRILYLYDTNYWSTCKNPVLTHLRPATPEMKIWKPSSRQQKNGLLSLHLTISSNTELILIINRWLWQNIWHLDIPDLTLPKKYWFRWTLKSNTQCKRLPTLE